jgi:hypothetical protein
MGTGTPRRRTVACDLAALRGCPDLATIDVLARLQLALRPCGVEILFSGASPELAELIAFAGLSDVLRVEPPPAEPPPAEPLPAERPSVEPLSVEPRRQAEEREEGVRVEEEGELDDLAG